MAGGQTIIIEVVAGAHCSNSSSWADCVARVTESDKDSAPGARGSSLLGSSFPLITGVRVNLNAVRSNPKSPRHTASAIES